MTTTQMTTTQRVTGDVQLTAMSTKATAFTINELLRPDLRISANRGQHNAHLHQQKITCDCETTCSSTADYRPHRGKQTKHQTMV